jgi:DNA-binding winged helix-turn-helix (wHTH) protein/TolB-like protein/Tfp pilus assembly protein PilF
VKRLARNGIRHLSGFGDFRLDSDRRRLLRNGEIVPLSPKAIETLLVLVQNAGKVLDRETLMQAVWADTIVEDANLTVAISQLRKALGHYGDPDEFIQTIPRVGYRFIADVHEVMEEPAPLLDGKDNFSQSDIRRENFSSENGAEPGSANGTHLEPRSAIPEDRTRAPAQVGIAPSRSTKWRTLAVVAVLGFGVIGFFFYASRAVNPRLPANGAEVKSMAVLPLKTLGAKPGDDYLGLGLADALITRLGRMRQIAIRPTSAVQKYAELDTLNPIEAGRELGVEAVLEGSVQLRGDALRVTLRLLRVEDGVALWSGKFDDEFTDIFALQDSISEQVAEASALSLSRDERDLLTKHYTGDVEAYRLYLKGRYFWNKRTQAGSEQSLKYFRLAIEADPTYAPAYAGLADAYAILVWQQNLSQNEFVPKAKAAAAKALEIDETIAEAHASLGFVKFWYDWDFAGAETEYRRAIQLNPNYSTAHHWYGESLVLTGRAEEGFRELALAQQADPLSLIINSDIGKMFFFTGQQDRAIEQLQKVLEMDPNFPIAHLFLAMAHEQKGEHESAIAELEQHAKSAGGRTIFAAELGYIYGRSGRRSEALAIVQKLKTPASTAQPIPAYEIALVYAGLGEKKLAFEWLSRARAEHDPFLIYVQTDPNFDSLRDDSELVTLLK